jgi:nucleoid-associated protein YgaU
MIALRKDVKVGLTIGAIVVAVVGVYAGLSSLTSDSSSTDNTAKLFTAPSNQPSGNTSPTVVTDRAGAKTPAVAQIESSRNAPMLTGLNANPAEANPPVPVAVANRKDNPWDSAFASGQLSPTVTEAPTPGQPAGNLTLDPSEVIKSLNSGEPEPSKTASTNDGSGAMNNSPAQATLTKAGDQTHTIAPGETLSSISAAYFGDPNQFAVLIAANPQVNPNKLKPGTVIRIPAVEKKAARSDMGDLPSVASAPLDPTRQYVVKVGDSLHKIASTLYGDIGYATRLYDSNKTLIGPDPARLKVGMVLSLPEAPKKQ